MHQLYFGNRRGRCRFNNGNKVVNIRQRHGQTFQSMPTLTGFFEVKHGATRHHFAAVAKETIHQLQKVQRARLVVHQCYHVHAEGVLQLGLFIQIVEHDFGHFAALELNDHAHAGFVGLIAQIRNAFNFLFVHQLGNALNQRALVHLVRNFVHNNGLTVGAFGNRFKMRFSTHDHPSTPSAVAFTHTRQTINNAASREVGRGH